VFAAGKELRIPLMVGNNARDVCRRKPS